VTARVCNAGHGGQILITVATRDEMAGSLLPEVDLESLGVYHLHELPEAEELFQVTGRGLISSFPAPRV
jgi:class 3 adenylate cyclase